MGEKLHTIARIHRMQYFALGVDGLSEQELCTDIHSKPKQKWHQINLFNPASPIHIWQRLKQNIKMPLCTLQIFDLHPRELWLDHMAVMRPLFAFGSENPVSEHFKEHLLTIGPEVEIVKLGGENGLDIFWVRGRDHAVVEERVDAVCVAAHGTVLCADHVFEEIEILGRRC